jgi:hypothetical protein
MARPPNSEFMNTSSTAGRRWMITPMPSASQHKRWVSGLGAPDIANCLIHLAIWAIMTSPLSAQELSFDVRSEHVYDSAKIILESEFNDRSLLSIFDQFAGEECARVAIARLMVAPSPKDLRAGINSYLPKMTSTAIPTLSKAGPLPDDIRFFVGDEERLQEPLRCTFRISSRSRREAGYVA